MGQYYYAALRDPADGKMIIGNPHHFDYGLKLMENGFVDSTFVKIVFSMLMDHPMQVAWVGDYAQEKDLLKFNVDSSKVKVFIDESWEKNDADQELLERYYPGDKVMGHYFGEFVVINHTKKEFFDQHKYWKRVCPSKNPGAEYMIDPLVALVAIGNGKGGGDFWGVGEEEVGRWATDTIEITPIGNINESDLIRDGYKEIEPCFIEGE